MQIDSSHADAIDLLFGYTGRDWDEDVGLQYNRARWYDPATGRWLSQDPIGFAAGDANLYRYVGNGPVDASDPSGLVDQRSPEAIELRRKEADRRRAQASYDREMDRYNRELFDYYQRLMHVLVLVGDELAANGIRGVNSRFPWLAGNFNCTEGRGYVKGSDGESVLGVEPAGSVKHPFPVNWNALREAIVYSMHNYGDFDDWWIVDGSSFNLHGFYIFGIIPYLFLSDEQFYGSEFGALSDMIHEPMHDVCMYGVGHGGPEKEIVPMIVSAKSKYGSAYDQLYWFLKTAVDENGESLWSKILIWIGPRPSAPIKPKILQ